jgi:hypothetical protein
MRDFRVSGDASQDSESPKPEDVSPVSASKIFSDERDLEDELPEEEPLTPEMVEEEAVRGDFMLRWAVVGLAVLMGFTQINDTKPLVLIQSGDYMRAHGLLPPRTDVFSLTMAEKPAPNVSWLFDHVVSLCWAMGGEKRTYPAESNDGGHRGIPAGTHLDSRRTQLVEFDLRSVRNRGMFVRFCASA